MPTRYRYLFLFLLLASAPVAQAQADGPSLGTGRSTSPGLQIALLPADAPGALAFQNDDRLARVQPPAQSPQLASEIGGRRLRFQIRNLIIADDRLELGRVRERALTTRLLAGADPMWSMARHSQDGGPAARLQLSYQAGAWAFALGTSPQLKDGHLQVRLSYSVRY